MNSLYDPPYKSLVEIISSPGFNNFNTASIAAKPEPKASPNLPFSILANELSRAVLVGLWVLLYSKPLWSPGLF